MDKELKIAMYIFFTILAAFLLMMLICAIGHKNPGHEVSLQLWITRTQINA
jgi:NADH:ubiquinone oxidoreductase subunit 6 (subunit J)